MIDLTKPLRTKEGYLVRILANDVKGSYPVVGAIQYSDDSEGLNSWTREGKSFTNGESRLDLENIPEEKKEWWNVYEGDKMMMRQNSLESAHRNCRVNGKEPSPQYLCTLEVTKINGKIVKTEMINATPTR